MELPTDGPSSLKKTSQIMAPSLTEPKKMNLAINNIGPVDAQIIAKQVLAALSQVQGLEDNPL